MSRGHTRLRRTSRAPWGDNLQFAIYNLQFSISEMVKALSAHLQPTAAVGRQIQFRHHATIQLDRLRRLSSRAERRGHRASKENQLIPG